MATDQARVGLDETTVRFSDAEGHGAKVVATALGAALVASAPVGWGDSAATLRLDLADGRTVSARRVAGPAPAVEARRLATVMERLAEHGIPVPRPTLVDDEADRSVWLVTPWVDGATGATWLGDPARGRHLAERMGRLVGQLGSVDTTGLDLDVRAATSPDLAAQARALKMRTSPLPL
jgi:hypothetical protein